MGLNIKEDINAFVTGVTFHPGDFVSLFSLFFDNLSTLLGFSGAILGLNPSSEHLQDILYKRIVPAAGIMLFLGNVYYTWQAIRMKREYGIPYTAQPYGFNTAGGFPFIFGIIYGVYYSYDVTCTEDTCTAEEILAEENDRITTAWQVCVAANFLTGLINVVLGFFGRFLMKLFPVGAMLVPLAGIGLTWLALNQIAPNFELPSIGLIPVFLIFTQYYALGRFHVAGKFYLPEAVPIVIFGIIAGWSYGTQSTVTKPVASGVWAGGAFIEGLRDIGPYMGTVLPFSIAASFGDMMCLVSAQKAGNPFPITETMVSDGIGTVIGSILGSPFGTVVYIGHPVHKRVGAQTGYSIMNGTAYLVLCLSGVIPTILSIVPVVAIGPVIFIFGLMICEECCAHINPRHYCIIFFGIFFGITDYIFTTYVAPGNTSPHGPFAMSKGSALSCMLWCSIITFTIDRRWIKAAMFCVFAAVFAGIGLIHQSEAFAGFTTGTGGNVKSTSPFEFMMGYLSLAAVCLIYHALQVYIPKKLEPGDEGYEDDHGYLPPIEDGAADGLFDAWWEPAEKGKTPETEEASTDKKVIELEETPTDKKVIELEEEVKPVEEEELAL